MPPRRLAPAGLALLLLFGVAACGGGDPLPAGGADPGGPVTPGAGASPTPPATPTPRTPAPPEHFAGLPVFPGSRVIAIDMDGDEWRATYRTERGIEDVAAFYERALPEGGWEVEDRTARRAEIEYDVRRGDDEGHVKLRLAGGGDTEIRLEVKRD